MKEVCLGLGLENYVNLGLVLKYTVFYSQLYIASRLQLWKVHLGKFSLYCI